MKIALIIFGVLAIGVLGFFAFTGEDVNTSNPSANNTQNQTPSTQTPSNRSSDERTGKYVDYSPSVISDAEKSEKVILFFHAPWCSTCRTLDTNIVAGAIPDDVTIVRTDFDSMTELRKKYGVTFQHTLVQVDNTGQELKKWSHSFDLDEIIQEII